MTIYIDGVWVLVFGVLLIIAQGLLAYWFSYMKKSGNYQSDKENISDLTEKVEKVKSDFDIGLERIKASLASLSQQTFSISNEERSAIFNFNDKYYKWLHTTRTLAFFDYEADSTKALMEGIVQIETEYKIAEARLELFFPDPNFKKLRVQVYLHTNQLQDLLIECFSECQDITHSAKMFTLTPNYDSDEHLEMLMKRPKVIELYEQKQLSIMEAHLFEKLKAMRSILFGYIKKVFEQDWK